MSSFKNAAGTESWRVSGTKLDGTRVRKNFKNKADALKELSDLELDVEGQSETRKSLRTSLTPEQLTDAETAFQQIGSQSLSKIIFHYFNLRRRACDKGVDLDQAINFFETRYRQESKNITIFNAKIEFMDSRHGISKATKENYDIGLSLLLKKNPNRFIHEFTVMDLEEILKPYNKIATRRTFRTIFSTFFSWAVRHHYALENPCKRLDKLPTDMSRISVLSLNEVRRLLYASARLQDGASAACIAIGLFAGLRPSEIRDLKQEDVFKDKIRVTGGKLRRRLKRSVPIPEVLTAWLNQYPFTGLPIGWDGKMKKLKQATNAKSWVQDVIRHTSITFQTERDKNEALTAYNCGTSIQMMNRHYRDVIDDDGIIAKFWSLTPEKLFANPPEVKIAINHQVDWPDQDELARLVWEKPLSHAAAELRVSDVALRKKCLKLGIKLPNRGYWLGKHRGSMNA